MKILKARTEFASALNQIHAEHGIEPEVIISALKEALAAAYRRDFSPPKDEVIEIEVNPETGENKIFQVLDNGEKKDITPPGFGRIAAQVAKQVLIQKIREGEKAAVLAEYEKKIGGLVSGTIIRFDGPDVIVEIGNKAEAVMPSQEKSPLEKYRLNQKLTFYIKEIQEGMRGKHIVVSRADKRLVEALFRREVPEVAANSVEIKEIAREPGSRSKVAVMSRQPGVDPVGSCVGQKGVRVQAVINELGGEKIDIIQYSDDPVKYITAALSPAENLQIGINEKKKTAKVKAAEDQLSLAIGRDGQNVRLAAKLTGYKIDVQVPRSSPAPQAPVGVRTAAKKTSVKKVKSKKAKKDKEKDQEKG